MLVKANSKPHDIVIYTDGWVTRDRPGFGLKFMQGGRTVHEDNGACRVTTSSLTMEVETVASLPTWHTNHTCYHLHRFNKPAAKCEAWDELPRLAHGRAGLGSPRLHRLLWIYSPGHCLSFLSAFSVEPFVKLWVQLLLRQWLWIICM